MKNVIYYLVLAFSLLACRKDDNNNEPAPADASVAKYLFDAVRDEVDQQVNNQAILNGLRDDDSGPRGGCATVTVTPLGNTFPKTVTIVFPDNCTTFAGASIEGTVVINISGKVREAGTVAVFSLKDFKYKSFLISGNYNVRFNGANSHTTTISDGKVITPAGKTITYSAINSATQTEGTGTTFRTNPANFMQDDVYEITTNSQGINSNGNAFKVTTEKSLIYKVACQWITSGKLMINEESRPNITAFIDYGDGTCDNKAILTFNSRTIEITLP